MKFLFSLVLFASLQCNAQAQGAKLEPSKFIWDSGAPLLMTVDEDCGGKTKEIRICVGNATSGGHSQIVACRDVDMNCTDADLCFQNSGGVSTVYWSNSTGQNYQKKSKSSPKKKVSPGSAIPTT